MIRFFILLGLVLITAGSCKEAPKTTQKSPAPEEAAKSLLEKLADKHGFENWKDVSSISFTFNVDRDTLHIERSWIWEVRENRVTRISPTDTVSYLRSEVDSTLARTDATFINDKYWFLAPYQWVWDAESFSHTYEEKALAPISGDSMPRLTIVYGQEGGYTPGDAYDFYLGEDSLVREWVFRRGNQPEPSVTTTWEGYEEIGGLMLATSHQNAEGSFKISFTGISVD
jgi:hypothetical protein